MRLIDADKLEVHEQLKPLGNGKYEYIKVVYKDDIDDVSTINQWIPCTDRLPNVGEPVLFSVDGLYVTEGCLMWDGDWCQFIGGVTRGKNMVDAWCPLPDPYVEEIVEKEKLYCDRNICLLNEYNNIGCEDCKVNKGE